MSLAEIDLTQLKQKILNAYKADDPLFSQFRQYARQLGNPKKLGRYSVNAVAFVATDGGDNRLTFNPAAIELVRIVDSNGHEYVLDAVANSSKPEDLDTMVKDSSTQTIHPLMRLCKDIGFKKLTDLSSILEGLGKPGGKSNRAIRCYRDIVEWAVLYDLIHRKEWGGDTIFVRDGLLRTLSFKPDIFPKVDIGIRTAFRNHTEANVNLALVGVAKQNRVLNKLALALELEDVFHKPFPCFAQVPKSIEEVCYDFEQSLWLSTFETSEPGADGQHRYQSMGQLFLVKFGDREFDPVWPVDIAEWQVDRAEEILGQLVADAQEGFPIPNYPLCIQKAHRHAQLSGFEMQVLQDLLTETLADNLTEIEKNRLLKFKHLSQSFAELRYKK